MCVPAGLILISRTILAEFYIPCNPNADTGFGKIWTLCKIDSNPFIMEKTHSMLKQNIRTVSISVGSLLPGVISIDVAQTNSSFWVKPVKLNSAIN